MFVLKKRDREEEKENEIKEKELKRAKNRISAKKSKEKRKKYIKQLEDQLEFYKAKSLNDETEKKQGTTTEKMLQILFEKEKEIKTFELSSKLSFPKQKLKYFEAKKTLLATLVLCQMEFVMPLEYKILQDEFQDFFQLSLDDSIETIIKKIDENIKKLVNIFSLKNSIENAKRGKAAKNLLNFYDITKRSAEYFLSLLDITNTKE